jgi:hypothetical protein
MKGNYTSVFIVFQKCLADFILFTVLIPLSSKIVIKAFKCKSPFTFKKVSFHFQQCESIDVIDRVINC